MVSILTINMLFQGMEAQVGTAYFHLICDQLMWKTDYKRLFSSRTVYEYITGYKEYVSILGVKIPIQFPGVYPNVTKANNPSYQQKSTMLVGESDKKSVYDIVEWRGMSSVKIKCPWGANPLPGGQYCPHKYPCCQSRSIIPHSNLVPVWGTEIIDDVWDKDANKVHGRNGEQFQPGLTKDSTLIIFNDIVYRALKFVCRDGEHSVYKGIKMLRFSPDPSTFMNSTQRPSNARYYQFGPYGLLGNLSMLEQGADLYASLPHFLYGDPSLHENIIGLHPDEKLHRMVLDIEPILGQTFFEHARAQISARLKRGMHWGYDDWFPHVRDGVYVPIAWFNQVSMIRDSAVEEFDGLVLAQNVKYWCTIIGAIISCLLLAYCALLYKRHYI